MKARVSKKYAACFAMAAAIVLAAGVHVMLGREKPKTIIIYSDSSLPQETSESEPKSDRNVTEPEKTKTSRLKNDSSASKKETSPKKQTTVTTSKNQTKTKTTKAKTTKATKAPKETVKPAEFPIDINKVSYNELIQIDGVGEVTANSILRYRDSVGTIHDMDKLLEISGIGDATLLTLKKHLYVSDTDKLPETVSEVVTSPPEVTESIDEDITEPPVTDPVVTEPEITDTEPPEPEPERQEVDLNTADAEELSEKLLIDIELAERIVELRDEIEYFENYLELKYVKGMTNEILKEIRYYLIIER